MQGLVAGERSHREEHDRETREGHQAVPDEHAVIGGGDAERRPQSAGDIVGMIDALTSGGSMPALPRVLLSGPGAFRRALVIYAAASVAITLLAKAAIIVIGLPSWVFAGSFVVMAVGLPVVLWTGYVQHVERRVALATPTYTPGGTPTVPPHGTIATIALKAAPIVPPVARILILGNAQEAGVAVVVQ